MRTISHETLLSGAGRIEGLEEGKSFGDGWSYDEKNMTTRQYCIDQNACCMLLGVLRPIPKADLVGETNGQAGGGCALSGHATLFDIVMSAGRCMSMLFIYVNFW